MKNKNKNKPGPVIKLRIKAANRKVSIHTRKGRTKPRTPLVLATRGFYNGSLTHMA